MIKRKKKLKKYLNTLEKDNLIELLLQYKFNSDYIKSELDNANAKLKSVVAPELKENTPYYIIYRRKIYVGWFNGEYWISEGKVKGYILLFYPPDDRLNGWYNIEDIYKTNQEAQQKLAKLRKNNGQSKKNLL